jgi:polysaccharide export outer membrane protein
MMDVIAQRKDAVAKYWGKTMLKREPRFGIRSERNVSFVLISCLLVFGALPCIGQTPSVVNADQLPPILTGPYKIQVGDVLNIDFFKTTDLNQTRTVGPDGEVFLALIGRVKVVGRTVDDITAEITEGYRQEMVNPQITVNVAEFAGLTVYVGGEVNRPGMIAYRGGLSLIQGITEAGGFTVRARRKEVLLIRPGPENKPVGTIVDVKQILRKGQLTNDVSLAPLDIVYVHWKKIVNVNIFTSQYISENLPRFGAWMWYLPGYGE